MVDRDVFHLRLAKLQETLRQLRELEAEGRSAVIGDAGHRAQLERWLHLAIESTIDLGRHLVADRGWRLPATNREVFQVLREESAVPTELAEKLEGWAGLRNVLVHLYLHLDADRLFDALGELDQLEDFAARMLREAERES